MGLVMVSSGTGGGLQWDWWWSPVGLVGGKTGGGLQWDW